MYWRILATKANWPFRPKCTGECALIWLNGSIFIKMFVKIHLLMILESNCYLLAPWYSHHWSNLDMQFDELALSSVIFLLELEINPRQWSRCCTIWFFCAPKISLKMIWVLYYVLWNCARTWQVVHFYRPCDTDRITDYCNDLERRFR